MCNFAPKMEQQYPSRLLERAVDEFAKLPGIGRRTALRLVLKLLKQKPEEAHALADSLKKLVDEVKYCKVCHNISDTDVCDICGNPLRDRTKICVVENVRSVLSVERTGAYRGLYHVLGGVISPMDGIGPSQLEIDSLVERVNSDGVQEVIFALSPTMEGDTTNYYIYRKLEDMDVKVTVIARGIAQNDELQYTDEVTLGRALAGRTPFKM